MNRLLRCARKFFYSFLMVDTKIRTMCQCCFNENGVRIGFFKTETVDGHSITFDFYKVVEEKKGICESYYVVAHIADIFPAKVKAYNKKKLITLSIFLSDPKTDIVAEILLDRYLNVMLSSVIAVD